MTQYYNTFLLNHTLARDIGVNKLESAILQQLCYWHSKYSFQRWIYNTYKAWEEQIGYWSERTLRRSFSSLEKKGLIVSKRTKYCKSYRVTEEALKKIYPNSEWPKQPVRVAIVAASIYKDTETTQKISSFNYKKREEKIVKSFIKNDVVIDLIEENKISCIEKDMVDIWNNVFQYSLNPIKSYCSKTLKKKLLKLYHEKFEGELTKWEAYAKKVNSSRFLMGEKETNSSFKAVFPWLIKEETVDAILSDSYGVGDRKLDSENLDSTIQTQATEIKREVKEKISDSLKNRISSKEEEKVFKDYLMTNREYERDGDKYGLNRHMKEIGKYYMRDGYITPSHVFYPGNEAYKNRLFNSYLMSKYCGIDEIAIENKFNIQPKNAHDKGQIFHMLRKLKDKFRNIEDIFSLNTHVFSILEG